MADPVEAAKTAYAAANPFGLKADHEAALKAALAAADAARIEGAPEMAQLLEEAASTDHMSERGRDMVSRRLVREAAALITAQQAEIERLMSALKPFADVFDEVDQFVETRARDGGSPIMSMNNLRLSDFRRARAAMGMK